MLEGGLNSSCITSLHKHSGIIKMQNLVITSLLALAASGERYNAEDDMLNYLLKDYKPNIRPVKDSSHPVNMTIQLQVDQILQLDEKNQVMTSHVSFLQKWKDEFLVWNSSEYSAQKILNMPKSSVWTIDLYVRNSVGEIIDTVETFHRNTPSYAMLVSGGNFVAFSPYVLQTGCEMDTAMFPFDVQTCSIIMGSWMYESAQVSLSLAEPPIAMRTMPGDFAEWKISGTDAVNEKIPYNVMIEDKWDKVYYDEITFSITMKRNPMFYIYNILVPTALLGLIAIFSCLLPPESGERISFCLTTLLAIAVYAMVVADTVPESSRNVPIITCLMFLYMAIMTACTLWSVIAARFVIYAKQKSSPPGRLFHALTYVAKCSTCWTAKANHLQDTQKYKLDTKCPGHVENNVETASLQSQIGHPKKINFTEWHEIIVCLDKTFFCIFLLVYIIGTMAFLL